MASLNSSPQWICTVFGIVDFLDFRVIYWFVLVRLSEWLVVLSLCVSIGAHWAILQSVAWCGMAITYSQGTSLEDGLVKTFDGKHPCNLCKAIAEGKKSEKKQKTQFEIKKLELFSLSAEEPVFIAPVKQEGILMISILLSRTEVPPTPPPRFV